MHVPRVLLALHRPGLGSALQEGLAARGHEVETTRNMAATWVAVRRRPPDAILLAPVTADGASAEFASLLGRAADPSGPALIVLSDEPDFLEGRIDDFLPTATDAETAGRRVRFAVARRAALVRLRQERDLLARQSRTDWKTGLLNDRSFSERCLQEVSRARRQEQPIAVLAIDFDGFKALNDAHGHAFGDEALRLFASTLKRHLRDFDVGARTGGDEFSVLLPGTDAAGALVVAERLRAMVGALSVEFDGRRATLSVSCGVACWTPRGGADFDAIVRAADAALLAAKAQGRGRVVLHDPARLPAPAAPLEASEQAASGNGERRPARGRRPRG